MAEESDGSGKRSIDDIKEEVESLKEKLSKQQKLTEQIRKDRKKKRLVTY